MQKKNENWFASWFNTPYYHILYKDRDHKDAEYFMDHLLDFLKLEKGSKILDLACGKGRHAKYMNSHGYNVTGVDLSQESIESAKRFENSSLHFEVHDMCNPYPDKFDAVINLFTSFGYFEAEIDNQRTINAIKKELKPEGYGIIDFLNSDYIIETLVPEEIKVVEGIAFHLKRYVENGYILKNITFYDDGKNHQYMERVKALTLDDFKHYFNEAGLQLQYTFGDYRLNPYDSKVSERLILIFK